jgi:RNA polymerase sigma-70 factor (ECF subfamily)
MHAVTLPSPPGLAQAFDAERSFLWGLCYRLTGSAADADDIVQDTFVRALERPPARTDEPWRPWLVRVALNRGRDVLRYRRRRHYEGPWLPSPIETADEERVAAGTEDRPDARYDLLESVSLAFLLALEALTPAQRAVLLLRDVFDYSVREAADALELGEANVRTTHLRARRAMESYDRRRARLDPETQQRTAEALERFLTCLAQGDVAGVEDLLSTAVRSLSDGGGEFHGARVPVLGRDKVARLYLGLSRKASGGQFELRMLNGLPAVVAHIPDSGAGWARRIAFQCLLDDDGKIVAVYAILASRKLSALSAPAAP